MAYLPGNLKPSKGVKKAKPSLFSSRSSPAPHTPSFSISPDASPPSSPGPSSFSDPFTYKFKPDVVSRLSSLSTKCESMGSLTQLIPESKVLVMYVGGTIGMKKENGVYKPVRDYMGKVIRSMPMLYDSEYAKEIGLDKADQKNIFVLPVSKDKRVVYHLKEYDELKDSSNVNVGDWLQLVEEIHENYRIFDGFVIIHGTDTMAYTASALSFMLENLGKPVVLTGSQVPLSELRSDGRDNFLGAVYIAGHYVIPEVTLFFNNKLYRGNRCVKVSSESFKAFDSPNLPPLVTMAVDITVNWANIFRHSRLEAFRVHTNMNRNVGLLRIFPSITAETVKTFLYPPMQGVVLQTYGAGNCPDDREDLIHEIQAATARGILILNCTQCSSGGVSPAYQTGRILLDAGVIPGSDITPEAALSKLSYVLGQEDLTHEEKKDQLRNNLRGEVSFSFDSGGPISLENNQFLRAVVDTLKLGSSKEVQAVAESLYPPLLCAAARNGDIQSIQHMKKLGADLSSSDYDGRTPLHLASCEGHIDLVRYLLENGCSIYVRDRFGTSPFMESIRNKRFDIIQLMKKTGGHLTHEGPHELGVQLCSAAAMDAVDGLRALQLAGVDMSCPDYSGNSALHVAAINGQIEAAQFLLETGAVPANKPNAEGFTAAQLSAQHGHYQTTQLIGEYVARQRAKLMAHDSFTLNGTHNET